MGKPTWQDIEAWAERKAKEATSFLDSPATDFSLTQYYRGRKSLLVELLKLPETKAAKEGRNGNE